MPVPCSTFNRWIGLPSAVVIAKVSGSDETAMLSAPQCAIPEGESPLNFNAVAPHELWSSDPSAGISTTRPFLNGMMLSLTVFELTGAI